MMKMYGKISTDFDLINKAILVNLIGIDNNSTNHFFLTSIASFSSKIKA